MIITSSQASWSWRHRLIRKSASLELLTQNLQAALEIKIQVIPVIDKFGKHYLDHKIIGLKLSTGFLKVVVYFLSRGSLLSPGRKHYFQQVKVSRKTTSKFSFYIHESLKSSKFCNPPKWVNIKFFLPSNKKQKRIIFKLQITLQTDFCKIVGN